MNSRDAENFTESSHTSWQQFQPLNLSGERVSFVYRIRENESEANKVANFISEEHSTELARAKFPEANFIAREIIGQIEHLGQIGEQLFEATISYPIENAQGGISTFIGLGMGNAGFFPNVELIDIHCDNPLALGLNGPRIGAQGIYQLLGRDQGAVAATALKPLGAPSNILGHIASEFAKGQVEIIKDDDGISSQPYAPFDQRIKAVMEALRDVEQNTGHKTHYFPNVSGDLDGLIARAMLAQEEGVSGVEITPGTMGLEAVSWLRNHPDLTLPIATHSAWSGGMTRPPNPACSFGLMFGLLPRLAGADIVIAPSFGVRFPLEKEECVKIVQAGQKKIGTIYNSLPMVGGGITIETVGKYAEAYDEDVILLVSGALFSDEVSISAMATKFTDAVKEMRPK